MNLIEIINDSCIGKFDIELLPDYIKNNKFTSQIINNTINFKELTGDELLSCVRVYNYLCIINPEFVDELLWKTRHRKDIFKVLVPDIKPLNLKGNRKRVPKNKNFYEQQNLTPVNNHIEDLLLGCYNNNIFLPVQVYKDKYIQRCIQYDKIRMLEDINPFNITRKLSNEYVYTAVQSNNTKILKLLINKGCSYCKQKIIYKAIEYGCDLELIQILKNDKCVLEIDRTFNKAVEKCNLETLKWLINNGCVCEDNVYYHAIKKCDIQTLNWMTTIKNIFETNSNGNNSDSEMDEQISLFNIAIENYRDIEILQWLVDKGFDYDDKSFYFSIVSYKQETTNWLIERGCKGDNNLLNIAIENCDSLDVIRLLLEYGYKGNDETLNTAIDTYRDEYNIVRLLLEYGYKGNDETLNLFIRLHYDINTIQLLIKNGYKGNDETLELAVLNRHNFDTIKLLLDCGCKGNDETLNMAIKCVDTKLDVIKLLLDCGYKGNENTLELAIQYEFEFDIIKLLIDHGCKGNSDILNIAVKCRKNNLDVIKLLLENGYKGNEEAFNLAIRRDDLSIINCIISYGCKYTTEHLNTAITNKIPHIVKFLLEEGVKYDDNTLYIAIIRDDLNVVSWVFNKGYKYDTIHLNVAVKTKSLQVVKFLLYKGIKYNDETLDLSIIHSDFNLINMLISKGCKYTKNNLHTAISNKRKDIINLLLEKGIEYDSETLNLVITNKNFQAANWLLNRGCQFDDKTLNLTIGNNKQITKILIDKGCKYDENSLYLVIDNHDYETAEWLINKDDCKYNRDRVMRKCINHDKLNLVMILINKGYEIKDYHFDLAINNKYNYHVVNWFIEQEFSFTVNSDNFRKAMCLRNRGNNSELLDLFKKRGYVLTIEDFREAVKNDVVVGVFQWLKDNHCPWSNEIFNEYSIDNEYTANWLEENGYLELSENNNDD